MEIKMKVSSELSPMTIGVDNSITKAMQTGEWGVRLAFVNDNNDSRFEAVLSIEEIQSLIVKLQKSLNAYELCNKEQK